VVGLLGEDFTLSNITLIIMTWTLLVVFSLGIGLIFMTLGKTFPETEKFLPILIKPLYFISCVMFPLHAIPKEYWPYLLWNPLIHVVELSREAVVTGYISEGGNLNYLALCSLVALFIGLAVYRNREEAMLTS
ncbi:TPA: ABC transporter permease, partial [Escherichia coli]|nr:ABC transporter permease [Escherichia coli]